MTEENGLPRNQAELNELLSDKKIWATMRTWKSELEAIDVKTENELIEDISYLFCLLEDINMLISEHHVIDTFIARFGTGDNRRRELLFNRSAMREQASFMVTKLMKLGLEIHEIAELVPFASEKAIQDLVENKP